MRPGGNGPVELLGDADVHRLLGGELGAIDLWTQVIGRGGDRGARRSRQSVRYRGLPVSHRVAGLTLAQADAAPFAPPFVIEIGSDRLTARCSLGSGTGGRSAGLAADIEGLSRWTAGCLTKDLQIDPLADDDIRLEAQLHLGATTPQDTLREFATAFSWDVAALHAAMSGQVLCTTEEWVRRSALSISRSTPQIPLRARERASGWPATESPRGVFCTLQPGGGLAVSENVLYVVRQDLRALKAFAPMPGRRDEWEGQRLTDVCLARDGSACLARSLLCEGYVSAGDGQWLRLVTDAVTAIAPWGESGFLLGGFDGQLDVLDHNHASVARRNIGWAKGRFSALVTAGDRALGVVGRKLFGVQLPALATGVGETSGAWSVSLKGLVQSDAICMLDVDTWSTTPLIALLGDDALLLFDATTGALVDRRATLDTQLVRWIGPGQLLAVEATDSVRSQLRVLHIETGQWTAPVDATDVTRLAVRGNEIHVGYVDQSIGVWDRDTVTRHVRFAPVA
jgi:hypothetical protein